MQEIRDVLCWPRSAVTMAVVAAQNISYLVTRVQHTETADISSPERDRERELTSRH